MVWKLSSGGLPPAGSSHGAGNGEGLVQPVDVGFELLFLCGDVQALPILVACHTTIDFKIYIKTYARVNAN